MFKRKKRRQQSENKQYEYVVPLKSKVYRLIRKFLFGFILASIVNFVFSYFFYTPKVYSLTKENYELVLKLKMLQEKIGVSSNKLTDIHQRDKNIYRAILGVDSTVTPIFAPVNDVSSQYKNNRYASMLDDSWRLLNNLSFDLIKQSLSFDSLQILSSDKGKILEALPAIWPINKNLLRGNIGAFGRRVHPIFKYVHNHDGADFAAPKGSEVYATAQGVVISSGASGNGYGTEVMLDHGFGYKTRYAHLSKTLVKVGQEIKRGMEIGKVGNTGNSTSPHLHYEVIYRGRPVNPLNYFSKAMRDEDFYKIINSAKETTYE